LIAALELKNLGYENVVVLEQADHVGGKVLTVNYGGHPYEMGAVITAPDYEIILELAKELDISLTATPHSVAFDHGEEHALHAWSKEKYGLMRMPKLAKDFSTFSFYVSTHKDFFKPGFANTPPEMIDTFENFAKKNGMGAVLEMYRPAMVGCGYGFAETKPAPYWMKLMKTFGHEYTLSIFDRGDFYRGFTKGWQGLWEKLVLEKKLNVVLNTSVDGVHRSKSKGVVVTAGSQKFHFDKLIVTIPHLAPKLMDDLSSEENEVFHHVRTIPYKVTLAKISGLPKLAHLWLRENSYQYDEHDESNDGKPVLISSNQNTNVYQIYQFTEHDKNSEELRAILRETLNEIGASRFTVIAEEMFTYFPHFTLEAFELGIPQQLDKMQGNGGVYFTGGLFNFETVEHTAQHARAMVRKFFARRIE
jgi:phytoene dehydrogenase-like protein